MGHPSGAHKAVQMGPTWDPNRIPVGVYICTKFNVLGINFIVGRFGCMIYVMKSMAHVVILDYLGYSLVN